VLTGAANDHSKRTAAQSSALRSENPVRAHKWLNWYVSRMDLGATWALPLLVRDPPLNPMRASFGQAERFARHSQAPPSAHSLVESQIEKGSHFGATKSGAFRNSDTAPLGVPKSRCSSEVALVRSVVGAAARRVADARRGRCVAHEDDGAACRRGPWPGVADQSPGSRRHRARDVAAPPHLRRRPRARAVDLANPVERQRGARGADERDPRVAHR